MNGQVSHSTTDIRVTVKYYNTLITTKCSSVSYHYNSSSEDITRNYGV